MFPENNNSNNNCNVVNDSDNDDKKEKEEENILEQEVEDDFEVTPETTLNQKMVRSMKNLQATCNSKQEKVVRVFPCVPRAARHSPQLPRRAGPLRFRRSTAAS